MTQPPSGNVPDPNATQQDIPVTPPPFTYVPGVPGAPSSLGNARAWITASRRNTVISAISGGVIGICLLCSCVGAFASRGGKTVNAANTRTVAQHSPTSTPVTNIATATVSATDTPIAKNTAVPPTQPPAPGSLATGGAERLGGTIDAFTSDLGVPDTSTQLIYRYNRNCGDTGNVFCVAATVFPGADGLEYVFYLDLAGPAPSGNWNMPTAQAVCGHYLPADAQFKTSITDVRSGVTVGVDRVYFSQQLANRFTADQFLDGNQNQVQRGLFDVFYLYNNSTDAQVVDCTFVLGTSQEQS